MPPNLRVVERVGLRERLEQPRQLLVVHADAGVADRERQQRDGRRPRARASRSDGTMPSSVNLAALLSRLIRLCLQLGQVGVHRADVGRALDDQLVAVLLDQRLDDGAAPPRPARRGRTSSR